MGVGGQLHAPAALPPGMTWYPLYRRLGRPQGRSERVRKISPPPGFDPRTLQPVARRYTDYAIPAHIYNYIPETNHVFTVAVLWLQFVVHIVFCTVTLVLSEVCVLCTIWLFSVVP